MIISSKSAWRLHCLLVVIGIQGQGHELAVLCQGVVDNHIAHHLADELNQVGAARADTGGASFEHAVSLILAELEEIASVLPRSFQQDGVSSPQRSLRNVVNTLEKMVEPRKCNSSNHHLEALGRVKMALGLTA